MFGVEALGRIAYDELGAVLRAEMTISVPKYFQVYRRTDDPQSKLAWRPLRQSTADMHLRADVSQKALNRYCCALAAVDDTSTLEELTARVERRVGWNGRPVRASHPFDPDDYALLKAIIAASSKSMAFATGICNPCYTRRRPRPRQSNENVRPASAENFACFARMA